MMRKAAPALAILATLIAALLPGSVFAQQGSYGDRYGPGRHGDGGYDAGAGWSTGGWSYGYWGQYRTWNPFLGLGGYYGCWRTSRIETPSGVRLSREWVCY